MSNYPIRKNKFPKGYPKAGTQYAKALECLEAESATCEEIAEYLNVSILHATSAVNVLLTRYGLVKRIGKGKYELIDAELVSLVYGSIENEEENRRNVM